MYRFFCIFVSMTIQDKIKACDYVINNMLNEQERIVYKNEGRIIQMNTNQFENGQGSDDKLLKNANPIFDGVYSLRTQLIDNRKIAGNLYNFYQTGAFLSGMQADLDNSLTKLNIFSTGTGSGDKALFFKGYTNLFGLNSKNEYELNYKIILPELLTWIKKYI